MKQVRIKDTNFAHAFSTSGYNKSNNINCSYTSQVDLPNLNVAGSLSTNSIETGRVEKGENSKQKFKP